MFLKVIINLEIRLFSYCDYYDTLHNLVAHYSIYGVLLIPQDGEFKFVFVFLIEPFTSLRGLLCYMSVLFVFCFCVQGAIVCGKKKAL